MNDFKIPSCAIGTWGWGKGLNGSRFVFGSTPSPQELSDCYSAAIKNNLFLFDTAAVYGWGSSEKILGGFSEDDDRIIIATKFSPSRFQRASALGKSLDGSLKRLKRNSVDILWIHNAVNLEKNVNAAIQPLKNGTVRHLGVSNCTLDHIKTARKILNDNGFELFGIQNHYSLIYDFSEKMGIIDYCKENQIAFFAYMILEQGILAGRTGFARSSRRGSAYSESTISKIQPVLHTLKAIGKKYHMSAAQIAEAHAVTKGLVPIVGARRSEQVEELAKAVTLTLSESEMCEIEKAAKSVNVEVRAAWE